MSGNYPLILRARSASNPTDEEITALISFLTTITVISTASKAIQGSVATFFFYYCFLHFNQEVEYIWSRPWTRGKAIYIMTRYAAAIFFTLMIITLLPFGWNEVGKNVNDTKADEGLSVVEKGYCFGGYLYVISGTIIFLLAQTILAMRVYALYARRKRIIVLSAILLIASAASMQLYGIVYLITPADNCIGTSCPIAVAIPYETTFSCTMASDQVSFFGWVSTSIVELVFLSLVLWKTRQIKRIGGEYSLVQEKESYARDITGLLARDSKKYFIWIFLICFMGTCLNVIFVINNFKLHSISVAIVLPGMLGNTFLTLAIAILAILAPNLLTSIRMEYYGPVGAQADEELSWDAAAPASSMGVNLGARRRESLDSMQYSMVEDQEIGNDSISRFTT